MVGSSRVREVGEVMDEMGVDPLTRTSIFYGMTLKPLPSPFPLHHLIIYFFLFSIFSVLFPNSPRPPHHLPLHFPLHHFISFSTSLSTTSPPTPRPTLYTSSSTSHSNTLPPPPLPSPPLHLPLHVPLHHFNSLSTSHPHFTSLSTSPSPPLRLPLSTTSPPPLHHSTSPPPPPPLPSTLQWVAHLAWAGIDLLLFSYLISPPLQ
ncbi:hypothetical protein Pcinc_041912 [Petrolisthes cinctipes]|uniref:Uncharacterized protein n=1 Tax=Petrolisthes cinctipes TaxID=88211 RepID=A0AAE1BIH6_PETCI|nr:hypothetical protein Pcinc_041912 [Petrolisthes cinctipes]